MDFKDRIKKLRADTGITYSRLASEFNKTEAAIRSWETGRTKPDADTLIKLAKYFDCSVDYLLGLSEFKNNEREKYEINRLESIITELNTISVEDKSRVTKSITYLVDAYKTLEPNNYLKNIYVNTVVALTKNLSLLSRMYIYTPQLIDNTINEFKNSSLASELVRLATGKTDTMSLISKWFNIVELEMEKVLPERIDYQKLFLGESFKNDIMSSEDVEEDE